MESYSTASSPWLCLLSYKCKFFCPGVALCLLPPLSLPPPWLSQHIRTINEENSVHTCLWAIWKQIFSVFRFLFPGNSSWCQVGKKLASIARKNSSRQVPEQLIIARIRHVYGPLDHSWKRDQGTQDMTGHISPSLVFSLLLPNQD